MPKHCLGLRVHISEFAFSWGIFLVLRGSPFLVRSLSISGKLRSVLSRICSFSSCHISERAIVRLFDAERNSSCLVDKFRMPYVAFSIRMPGDQVHNSENLEKVEQNDFPV
jgi:hypothetical protein